jgi:hypothetical protein
MKSIILQVFSIVAMQICNGQPNDELEKKTVLQLSQEWNTAVMKRDSATLEKILTPEFTLNGNLPRMIWMNNTLHHISTASIKTIGEPVVTIYDGSAIVTSILYWKASFDGKPAVDGEFIITDIWKKNKDQWQVLIRMSKPKS